MYLLFQSVILIRIDHAEARTEFLRQPCLFDATFLRHFFYPVYGLVHTFYLTLVYKGIKYHAIKREKRKKTLPLLHLIRYSLPAFLYCLLTVNHHTTYPLKGMCLRVNVRSSIPVLATVLTPDAIRSYLCGFFVLWKPFWADKIARFTTSEKTLNNFLRNTMQFLEKHYAVSAEIVQCFLEDV